MPFSKKWKDVFACIENVLGNKVSVNRKEQILNKIAQIVHTLVTQAHVYEDIVLNTAQLYIFAKETNFDFHDFEERCGKYVIEGVEMLLSNDLKVIFENTSLLYIATIKIAEYLIELTENKNNKTLVSEVKKVVKQYGLRLNKKIIASLVEICGK